MSVDGERSPSPAIRTENISSSLQELEEDFIIALESLPELWNAQHKYYTNKCKKQTGYEKLLKIYAKIKPNATVDDVRTKINSLKSNYRRELRKIDSSKSSGADSDALYTPKSKTFKLLNFLYNTEKPNNRQQSSSSEEKAPENNGKEQKNAKPTQEAKVSLISQVGHPPRNMQTPKTFLDKQNELIDRMNLLLSQMTLLSQKLMQETTTSRALALVWAEKLEKLQPQQRLLAEKAIHDYLFEAEMENFKRHENNIETTTYVTSAEDNVPLYSQNLNSPVSLSPSPANTAAVNNPASTSTLYFIPSGSSSQVSDAKRDVTNVPTAMSSEISSPAVQQELLLSEITLPNTPRVILLRSVQLEDKEENTTNSLLENFNPEDYPST